MNLIDDENGRKCDSVDDRVGEEADDCRLQRDFSDCCGKTEYKHDFCDCENPETHHLVSVKECAANPYYCVFEENKEGYLHICKGEGNIFRRQDAPKVYEYNGAIYVMNAKVLKTTHMHKMQKRIKYVMDDLSSFDLDTMWDWKMAEMIKKEKTL